MKSRRTDVQTFITARRLTADELRSMTQSNAVRAVLAARPNLYEAQAQLRETGIHLELNQIKRIATVRRNPRPSCLPEDGVIDELAIELVVSGARLVPLTPSEQDIAVRRILAAGGGAPEVANRLGLDSSSAGRLVKAAASMCGMAA